MVETAVFSLLVTKAVTVCHGLLTAK